jgi:D-alanyl-D-alanine carboxypeptidase
MIQFFKILFGGLTAVACGVVVAWAGVLSWNTAKPYFSGEKQISLANVTNFISSDDGTTISGLRRTVRYSANEEEDLIDAAVQSLPQSPDSKVTALTYIVKNLKTGDTPIEFYPDRLMPVASVTKLVTAAVSRMKIDQAERVTITRDIMSTYGNTAQFKVGETFSAGDLLYPLLMVSSNDAAEAIAEDYGRKEFVNEMNKFAQSIGAYRTYFSDPSGLSQKNVSTANDLAIILEWIYENDPYILEVTRLKSKTVRSHTWINPTHFLSWSYYRGGKNGYTPEANRTAATLFAIGPRENLYSVIILGSDSRDADTIKLLSKINNK